MSASVADLLAYDALPEDVRALAERVLGTSALGPPIQKLLVEAYEAGWDACGEAIETPYCSRSQADYSVRRLFEKKAE